MDLVRVILLKIEEEHAGVGLANLEVEGYDRATIAYHCQLLEEAGLVSSCIVRYADDFRIFCRNREDAEKTMEAVTRWITERLKLEVSPEKTRIVNVRKRYSEFLGFKIMVYRKGGKYVVKSHICDKKLQLEESKLVEQAKRIAKPAQGRTQPDEIGLFDEMVLGIQNYYRIATCISLDCRKIHRRVMTVLTNRLNTETGCQLIREGGAMTDSEKERFGASQMVRYVSGINRPIYPIAFIKYKTAIGISAAVCCFSPAGRKKIHDNLEMDTTLFAYLREHPTEGHSMEYADCRLSLLSAQKGKCAVSGEWFLQPDSIVCHMKVPKEQGGQERSGAAPQAVSAPADRPGRCRSQEHLQTTDCYKKTTDQNQQPAHRRKTGGNLNNFLLVID